MWKFYVNSKKLYKYRLQLLMTINGCGEGPQLLDRYSLWHHDCYAASSLSSLETDQIKHCVFYRIRPEVRRADCSNLTRLTRATRLPPPNCGLPPPSRSRPLPRCFRGEAGVGRNEGAANSLGCTIATFCAGGGALMAGRAESRWRKFFRG